MKFTGLENFKHEQSQKIGVLLVNLGTPEQPTPRALRTYLKEFLSDHRVVEIPKFIWWMILHLIILPFRAKRSAKAYQSIWQADGSPLLINTQKLTEKVAHAINRSEGQVLVDFAMRYGTPSVDSKIEKLQQSGAKKLMVIPLYPQYSATTTASTFDAVAKSFAKRRLLPELRFVNNYHDNSLYIKALAEKVEGYWQKHGKAEKLVLSYHGIPKRNWLLGDPYACEC
ncbi:MAG: ferrochelatase, partial [Gammaproteobacteria bacterium]|nr:ferrochelatase [Gammaproteobacteria bacterium]